MGPRSRRDAAAVTRELKLALIVGFALVLLVAVLISDHLSDARHAKLADASDKRETYIAEPVATSKPTSAPKVKPGPLASRDDAPDIIADVKKDSGSNLPTSAWSRNPLDLLHGTTGPVAVNTPTQDKPSPASATPPAPVASATTSPADPVPTIVQSRDPQAPAAVAAKDADTDLASKFRELGYAVTNGTIEKLPAAAKPVVESTTLAITPATTTKVTPVVPGTTNKTTVAIDPKVGAKIPAPADDATLYTIAAGDSLYKIAKKFYNNGEEWRRIAEANKLAEDSTLKVGSKIKIPAAPKVVGGGAGLPTTNSPDPMKKNDAKPAVPSKDAPKTKTAKPSDTRLASADTYVIQTGDTLGDIAKRKLGSTKRAQEIIALNPDALSDPDTLVVGAAIRLPRR